MLGLIQTEEAAVEMGAMGMWGAILGPALLVVGAITAVGFAIYGIVKAYNADAEAAEKARKAAESLKQAHEELQKSLEELESALDVYDKAKEKLDNLTQGTKEWEQATKDVNQAILDVITAIGDIDTKDLKDLYSRDEKGNFVLNREKADELLKQRELQTQAAGLAAIEGSRVANQKTNDVNILKQTRELNNKIPWWLETTIGVAGGRIRISFCSTKWEKWRKSI